MKTSCTFSEEMRLCPRRAPRAFGTLEWSRRYRLMRTHTAMHVLCGTVFRDYGALVTGGDMEPFKGRMDFEFATMRGELVREIEAAVNKEVQASREIRVRIFPGKKHSKSPI